jgi:prefoldin subunit 5
MDEGETIRQLMELNEQLRREIELLKARIKELEARLGPNMRIRTLRRA